MSRFREDNEEIDKDGKVISEKDKGVFRVVTFSRRNAEARKVSKLLTLQKIARNGSEPKLRQDPEARLFKTPE